MTPDIRELGILSLKEKHDDNRLELLKMIFSFENGKCSRKLRIRLFFTLHDVVPKNGKNTRNSFLGTVVTTGRLPKTLLKKLKIHLHCHKKGSLGN